MPETETGATICTMDGQGGAQRLIAYLTERFGDEKTCGFYETAGLRARMIYRAFERRIYISDICETSGQGQGYAHLELYIVADGDSGLVGEPPEAINVSRGQAGAVTTALSASPQ